jgi:hypothetical protein
MFRTGQPRRQRLEFACKFVLDHKRRLNYSFEFAKFAVINPWFDLDDVRKRT